jgi:hypothetical protein
MSAMNQSAAAPLADIPLSPSVEKALSGLSESAEVSSWGIVKELIKVHPDYGRDLGHKLLATPGPTVSQHRSLADWLADTYALFDKHKISELKTRWVILGLSQLDPDLAGYLDSFDYREALKSELKEPFESLLAAPPQTSEAPPNLASTSKAQTQTKSQAATPTPHLPPDPTVLLTDTPSPKDQLGRLGLAQALAEWLQRFWREANPAPGKGDGPSSLSESRLRNW